MPKEIKIFKKGESSLTASIDIKSLERLEETLNKRFITKVGILGNSSSRATITRASSGKAKITKDETLAEASNADIGLLHEFGSYTRHVPERSFLRSPLMLYLKDAVSEASSKINKAIMDSDIVKAYSLLGIAAEKVIQEAFKTGGFGQWQKLSSRTIAGKGSSAILIDSGQLRKSITSKVVTA